MEKKEKKIYEKPEIEVINLLNSKEILFSSPGGGDDDDIDPWDTGD